MGDFGLISYRVEHADEDFEAQVLLVALALAAPLNDADLAVHALDESQGDLVLRLAVGRDAVPVPVDHLGELLVGLQALPFECGAPVLEEATRPVFPRS